MFEKKTRFLTFILFALCLTKQSYETSLNYLVQSQSFQKLDLKLAVKADH